MMNIEDKTEFWDLIGKIGGDLDGRDWKIIYGIRDGENITQLAMKLGISRQAVHKRIRKIRKRLRQAEKIGLHFCPKT